MRKKLTHEQRYNKKYYQAHKGDPEFEERRARNAKVYRATKRFKTKRNAKLREKWATDPEYRRKMSEYQKEYRRRKRLERSAKRKVR